MEAQFRNVPDGLWEQIAPLTPARRKNTLRGRPCGAGVFTKVFSKLLEFYDRRRGIQWKWSSLDSAMVKAPKGGPHGPQPDRPCEEWRQTPHSDRRTGRSAGRRNH